MPTSPSERRLTTCPSCFGQGSQHMSWCVDAYGGRLADSDWLERSACVDLHEPLTEEICAGCPVIRDCLVYALTNNVTTDLWGGAGPQMRAELRRRPASAIDAFIKDLRKSPGANARAERQTA